MSRALDSPDRGDEERSDQYAVVEVAGSGLFGHPLLQPLTGPEVAAFRPALAAFETAFASAAESVTERLAIDFSSVLLGTSVLTRIASAPADIDILVYLVIGSPHDRVQPGPQALADAVARLLTALADAADSRGGNGPLDFVRMNVFLPLTHPGFPGAVKEYCCSWGREDLHIGSTVASLGTIELREAIARGGQPVLTLSTALQGVRIMVDVRIDLYRASGDGPVPMVMDAHMTWAGTLCSCPRGALLLHQVEQAMLRRTPGVSPATAALKRREAHAVLKVGQRRFPKALKYALQGLAFGGERQSAMMLAPFLRCRACTAAALGTRMSNLVTAVRRRWSGPEVVLAAARRLAEAAPPVLQTPDTSGLPGPGESEVSALLERWQRSARSSPGDPLAWANLHQVASQLKSMADRPALELLLSTRDAMEAMPRFREALKEHRPS